MVSDGLRVQAACFLASRLIACSRERPADRNNPARRSPHLPRGRLFRFRRLGPVKFEIELRAPLGPGAGLLVGQRRERDAEQVHGQLEVRRCVVPAPLNTAFRPRSASINTRTDSLLLAAACSAHRISPRRRRRRVHPAAGRESSRANSKNALTPAERFRRPG